MAGERSIAGHVRPLIYDLVLTVGNRFNLL